MFHEEMPGIRSLGILRNPMTALSNILSIDFGGVGFIQYALDNLLDVLMVFFRGSKYKFSASKILILLIKENVQVPEVEIIKIDFGIILHKVSQPAFFYNFHLCMTYIK